MNIKKGKKLIKELYDNGISAHECTGMGQPDELDVDEIEKFHKQYIEEE